MLRVSKPENPLILTSESTPAARIVNPNGAAGIFLVCEHASSFIPSSLNELGLAPQDRYSHAVWDIGAEALARAMADTLDAPLAVSCVSRLVYDCNRPPESPDAIPERTENVDVPGNKSLSPAERAARVSQVYDPFHSLVSEMLDDFASPPVFVTIHSFTPSWFSKSRPVELGLLHDKNACLANAMLRHSDPSLRTELNQPYSAADGVTHTLARHAEARGLRNVMIEVRNDLLDHQANIDRISGILCKMLLAAVECEKGSIR